MCEALANQPARAEALLQAGQKMQDALGLQLSRTIQAGAVRDDIGAADLHAIIGAAPMTEEGLPETSRGQPLSVVEGGLRTLAG